MGAPQETSGQSPPPSFRAAYLGYDDLTRVLRGWADAHPSFLRLESLTKTPEGRDVWILTIGRDPDRIRPAVWVDGNIHASELCGSNVALAIAEDLILSHASPSTALRDLPPHLAAIVRNDVLVYVVPRMSPDGAERVFATGAYVRSNPRDARQGRSRPRWRYADVDGDGQVRLMRRRDSAGDFVAAASDPNLLLPRRIEDSGPFYAVYPEGFIENWDGFTVPDASDYLVDSETDLNRNFPYAWAPEPQQKGAGAFATSEPESRAVTEFATKHPNIFAWMNLHTFGGCYIRPCGDRVDKKMDPHDLALFRQIEEWTTSITGYPMVSGFEEFTYEADKQLHGELGAFAYSQRGAIGLVCELWDFWNQSGLGVRRPFIDNYQRRTRDDVETIAAWDREKNGGRVVGTWRPFHHPELGDVEIGGYDPRIGIWNPPESELAAICEAQARVLFRIASLAPRVRFAHLAAEPLAHGLTRVTAIVENVGYLPTNVLSSAKLLPWNDALTARIELGAGLDLCAGEERQVVGHLDGWGGYDKSFTPAFARSQHGLVRRRLAWVVRGRGRFVLCVDAARVGPVEAAVEVG